MLDFSPALIICTYLLSLVSHSGIVEYWLMFRRFTRQREHNIPMNFKMVGIYSYFLGLFSFHEMKS